MCRGKVVGKREGRDNIRNRSVNTIPLPLYPIFPSPLFHQRQWCCQTKLQHISVFPFLHSACPPVFISLPIFLLTFFSFLFYSLPSTTKPPSFSQHHPLPHELWISKKLCPGTLPAPAYQAASSVANFTLPERPCCSNMPHTKVKLNPQRHRNLFEWQILKSSSLCDESKRIVESFKTMQWQKML